jgi:hypothetical protein
MTSSKAGTVEMCGVIGKIVATTILVWAGAALAEGEGLYEPKPPVVIEKKTIPPAPSKPKVNVASPLVGKWRLVVKGGMFCQADVTATFAADGGGIRGYAEFEYSPGSFTSVVVKGDAVRLTFDWVDALGDEVVSIYSGTFSKDGNMITGEASGEWDDGCTFKMTRR